MVTRVVIVGHRRFEARSADRCLPFHRRDSDSEFPFLFDTLFIHKDGWAQEDDLCLVLLLCSEIHLPLSSPCLLGGPLPRFFANSCFPIPIFRTAANSPPHDDRATFAGLRPPFHSH